ncbi:hypothetical protein OOT46_29035, partial [Aquabacterium sp. A7-Y]|nr:hypothetical protein [Aquabacterium sp. A7-Y]
SARRIVEALSTANIAALSTASIDALTTAHVASLTNGQIAALTTAHIAALNTADVVAFTTEQMAGLQTQDLQAFTTAQIVAFETADLAALTMDQAHAFTTTQVSVMSGSQLDALIATSPIVLDLDGDGVKTVAVGNGVMFDLNATGNVTSVGWASASDGLLVMDRNGDGTINDGRELFGSVTQTASGQRAGDGYSAMRAEDSNGDGKLTSADANFSKLQVWVDADSDGKTDAGELKSLQELGIVELDLNAAGGSEVDNGNLLALVSSYTTADGSQHQMADVWFQRDNTGALGSTATQVAAGEATSSDTAAQAAAAQPEASQPSGTSLTVGTQDLLAERGSDVLGGASDSASPTAADSSALEHHMALLDRTQQLLDEKQNDLLI